MIETYQIKENGYHPFLIREGWQVAQLNYMPEQHIDNITRLDVHHLTDERDAAAAAHQQDDIDIVDGEVGAGDRPLTQPPPP